MTRRLSALLNEANVPHTLHDTHIAIKDVTVHVLSTFWLGWQNTVFPEIAQKYANNIFVFDYEVRDRAKALINVLLAKSGNHGSLGARKMEIVVPNVDIVRDFMDAYHIQGFVGNNSYLGLTNGDDLVAVASFGIHDDHYELGRMAFHGHITGGLSRLVRAFLKSVEPAPLFSFCDPRYGAGVGYLAAGFEQVGETATASYFYANGTGLYHRLSYRKDLMKRLDFFDAHFTETQLAKANGLLRIEGMKQKRYVMK